jgi:cell division protein FtsA
MERVEKNQEVVLAIDIGTTKVCAIAGFKNDLGKLEVLGLGKVNSEGVLRGVVSNIEKTVNAIQEAIEITRRSANIDFNLVHVGIAGQHIKTLQHRGQLVREYSDSEISQKDIDRLVHDIHKLGTRYANYIKEKTGICSFSRMLIFNYV